MLFEKYCNGKKLFVRHVKKQQSKKKIINKTNSTKQSGFVLLDYLR